jgi:hypothetical protein
MPKVGSPRSGSRTIPSLRPWIVGLAALAAAGSARGEPDLLADLRSAYLAAPKMHLAYRLSVDGRPRAHVESYRAGSHAGVRVVMTAGEPPEQLWVASGDRLRGRSGKTTFGLPDVPELDRRWARYAHVFELLNHLTGSTAPVPRTWAGEVDFDCRSSPTTDDVVLRANSGFTHQPGPSWLDRARWRRSTVTADVYEISRDDGSLKRASGETSQRGRRWELASTEPKWSPGRWQTEIESLASSTKDLVMVDQRLVMMRLSLIEARDHLRDGTDMDYATLAALWVACAFDPAPIHAELATRKSWFSTEIEKIHGAASNARGATGDRIRSKEAIAGDLREALVDDLLERLKPVLDEVFADDVVEQVYGRDGKATLRRCIDVAARATCVQLVALALGAE